MYVVAKSLMLLMPHSSRAAMAFARAPLPENTADPSPNGQSFARRTASASSPKRITLITGPKTSSFMMRIEWSTPTSTVGA